FTPATSYTFVSTTLSEPGRIAVTNQTGTGTGTGGTRVVCGTGVPTSGSNSAGRCPATAAASGSQFSYRCGSTVTADNEPGCPVLTGPPFGGDLRRIGFSQTDIAVGDPAIVTGCTDPSFDTPGTETTSPTGNVAPPTLAGTNGTQPNGLTVVYQSVPNQPATTPDCTLRYISAWWSDSIIAHNTSIGEDTASQWGAFRNVHMMGGSAGSVFPKVVNMLVQDNMDVINPLVSSGGTGMLCCAGNAAVEGQATQRAMFDLNTSILDHQTFFGRAAQAANYRVYNPTCFKAGNCIAGNNYTANPPSTFWFPALGPCPGATVTTS